jgi:hypothetical protein
VVHLQVRDETDARAELEPQDRWQVLRCRHGQVADIRGFETQEEAVAYTTPRRLLSAELPIRALR